MPKPAPSPYALKRLRELCTNIHEENIAFLLRTTLADFPIPIIDEFFNGPKLNKPSGHRIMLHERQAIIDFAGNQSQPARNGSISVDAPQGVGGNQYSLNAPASNLKKSFRGTKSKCRSFLS
jgi:hypothetical protein